MSRLQCKPPTQVAQMLAEERNLPKDRTALVTREIRNALAQLIQEELVIESRPESVRTLGHEYGVDKSRIHRIRMGDTGNMDVGELFSLAYQLGISTEGPVNEIVEIVWAEYLLKGCRAIREREGEKHTVPMSFDDSSILREVAEHWGGTANGVGSDVNLASPDCVLDERCRSILYGVHEHRFSRLMQSSDDAFTEESAFPYLLAAADLYAVSFLIPGGLDIQHSLILFLLNELGSKGDKTDADSQNEPWIPSHEQLIEILGGGEAVDEIAEAAIERVFNRHNGRLWKQKTGHPIPSRLWHRELRAVERMSRDLDISAIDMFPQPMDVEIEVAFKTLEAFYCVLDEFGLPMLPLSRAKIRSHVLRPSGSKEHYAGPADQQLLAACDDPKSQERTMRELWFRGQSYRVMQTWFIENYHYRDWSGQRSPG